MRDKSGKYVLTTRLGAGGMGQVWAAIKHGADGLRMPCAIKVLHPALAMTNEDRERFFGEARIAAQLDHGRIVKVIDTSEVQGSPCLVMEWVDGVNLRQLLEHAEKAGTARLAVDISLYIVGEILSALEYAHGRTVAGQHAGVVHYDVTPGNILVSSSGEVKLTDFGIARFAKTADATMSRSVGTPRYMSPEQMTGRVRTQTDIYSLGVVLHELLDGERFIGNCSVEEFQARVLGGYIPPLTRPDVPAWVDELRRQMLQTRPEDRPSAGDAYWIIAQNTARYQVAARELKLLYARVVGKPRSGFTDLIELRDGLPVASFAEPDSQPHTHADGPVEVDAPAVLRKPNVQLADRLVEHHTSDRTDTRDVSPWGPPPPVDAEPSVEATIRLSALESPLAASPPVESAIETEPVPVAPPEAGERERGVVLARPSTFMVVGAVILSTVFGGLFFGSLFVAFNQPDEPPVVVAAKSEPPPEPKPKPKVAPPVAVPANADPVRSPPLEPGPTVTPGPAPAVESEPDELEPKSDPVPEVEPKPTPAPKPKPASKASLEVTFVIQNVTSAELKVGKRSVSYRGFAMLELKPGTYAVQWRKAPNDPWQTPGSLRIEDGLPPGTFYEVKLTATTLAAKPNSKGSAKR